MTPVSPSRSAVRVLAGAGLAALLVAGTFTTPSFAAATAASGERCTIVGTSRADRLVGTPGRDVICGLGGDDVIDGRGGNDIIDGGKGNDRLRGGSGKDRVIGGAGRDKISGGTGADRLVGGTGNDTIRGESGSDALLGSDGSDVISGGSGADTVTGGAGHDDLSGGTGNDKVSGGSGNDEIEGHAGDDDLTGGSGADDVDGGSGFNLCDTPRNAGDTQIRCAQDRTAPQVGSLNLSPSTVDVSTEAKRIRVRARIIDDTGVKQVQMGHVAELVQGTRRDGIWQAWIPVPRYIAPGERTLDVWITDRVGRSTSHNFTYSVRNDVVDVEMPVVAGVSLSATAIDVRSKAQEVTGTVRITDDLAGATQLNFCLQAPPAKASDPYGIAQGTVCQPMDRISGTAKDSRWRASVSVPKSAVGGVWNTSVQLHSAADDSRFAFWLGPEAYARVTVGEGSYDYQRLPVAGSRVTVTGTAADRTPPTLSRLTLSRTSVDTSAGAVRIDVEIKAKDASGITQLGAELLGHPGWPGPEDYSQHLDLARSWDFTRTSGTAKDGVWKGSLVIPGGAPDGRYYLRAYLDDGTHFSNWTAEASQWGIEGTGRLDATTAPGGAIVTVANRE